VTLIPHISQQAVFAAAVGITYMPGNTLLARSIRTALLPRELLGTTLKKLLSTPRFANAKAMLASEPSPPKENSKWSAWMKPS